jgi:tripartite-type tricarboxylate transporter receptor subunit TctC
VPIEHDDRRPPNRRTALQAIVAAGASALGAAAWSGTDDKFPSRPIRLLVGSPAGATFDLLARAASAEAARQLGQPIIIENKSGAGGTPSFLAAKAAAPDGYTLVVVSLSTLRQPLLEDVGYDPIKDFTWIASLAEIGFALLVPADSPFKTWADLLAFGRAHPEKVSYGAPSGLGNSAHVFTEEVAARDHLKWTPVPFRGSSDCMQALLGGQLTFSVDTLISAAPLEQGGKIRILAMATDKRQAKWPSIPTMRELGYTVSIDSPMGIGGPARMEPAVVKTLQDAYKFAVGQPSYIELLDRSSQRPRYMGSDEFTRFAVNAEQEQRALLTKYGLIKQ